MHGPDASSTQTRKTTDMKDLHERIRYWVERIEVYNDIDYVCPEFMLRELKAVLRELKSIEREHESNLDFLSKQKGTIIYERD